MESPERRIMESFLEILVFEPLTGGHSLCVSPWHQHMKSTEANLNYCPHCVSVRGWITGEPALVGCDITVAQLCLDRQSLDQPCLFIFTGAQAPWTWEPWYLLQVTQESGHPSGLSTHAWTLQAHTHRHNIILARQGCGVVLWRRWEHTESEDPVPAHNYWDVPTRS